MIRTQPSPNCGPRRGGITAPDLVVLHYTAMTSAQDAIEVLCDPAREVSAHYVISKQGEVTNLVPEKDRAWHAGAGTWAGSDDINSRSIGIELDNDGSAPFSAPLMDALEGLLAEIKIRWTIPAQNIIAHSDLAPDRKIDPGPRFDWRRLALQGLAIWPAPGWQDRPAQSPLPQSPLPESLTALGYAVEQFGEPACLAAFRARFRPEMRMHAAALAATEQDARCVADLAARFAVDPAARLP